MSEREGGGAAAPLWSGRLAGGIDPALLAFSASLSVDRRLLRYDVAASQAHVRMLARQGILEAGDADAIVAALATVTVEEGASDEDVHSLIERQLVELLGETGKRVHAGRSRNDQVATAFRLWCRDAACVLVGAVGELQATLVEVSGRDGALLLPGFTHLQRAQPVTLGHHLAAHAVALERDAARLRRAYEAAGVSPLGAGALAGSSLPLAPESVAADLGLDGSFANSLDAVSDRDFALDLVYAATVAFVHLSRMAEELVLWTSQELAWAELADSVATGSSMMPQKKNPDVAELVRGRAGTSIGRLVSLLAMLKGLPLAYNRDLQEDKEPVFAQVDALAGALGAMSLAYRSLRFDADRMRAAADDGLTVATDVAEALVASGVPFREAHHRVAAQIADGGRFSEPTADQAVAARSGRGMPGRWRAAIAELAEHSTANRSFAGENLRFPAP
jgi:argininosuccinate lyase